MERTPLPERLEGPRIFLQGHPLSLAEAMFRAVDADRERLRAFLPWVDMTLTVEDEVRYILTTQEGWELGSQFDYGMYERATGSYLGNAAIHTIRWEHACCEVGYWILGAFEGRGYVAEAVALLEAACFQRGFHRIEIRCNAHNARSAAVPRRLGYELDGTLRQNAIEHGQYRDTLVFGKLNPAG